MDARAPSGAPRRVCRRLAWVALILCVLPMVLFGASNLLLATPWVRSWAAGKLEARTGLPASIGNISWSPWNGATARNIRLLQPEPLRSAVAEPLLNVESIQISPVWKAWLRGSLEMRSLRVSTPRLVIPIEMLAHLAAGPGSSPAPVAVAAAPDPATPAGAAPPPVAPTREIPPTTAPAPAPPAAPTGWLHLSDASLALISTGRSGSLFEISEIRGAIPCSGDPASSFIHVGSVSAFQSTVISDATLPISWQPPFLQTNRTEIGIGSVTMEFFARLSRQSGFPLQLAARIAPQPLPETQLPAGVKASAASVAANARFAGLLMAPASWQADWIAETAKPAISAAGEEISFAKGRMIVVLRGGVLTCPDARLTSELHSVLGNATIFPDGRFAAVARSVASLEDTLHTVRRIFPAVGETISLTPLSTPQRVAFDVEYFGDFSRSHLRLGREGPLIDLKQAPTP